MGTAINTAEYAPVSGWPGPGPSLVRVLPYGGGGWVGPRPFLAGWVSHDPPPPVGVGHFWVGGFWDLAPKFFFAFVYRVVVKNFFMGGWVGGLEPPPPPPLWG